MIRTFVYGSTVCFEYGFGYMVCQSIIVSSSGIGFWSNGLNILSLLKLSNIPDIMFFNPYKYVYNI
ncbi:MAG: hypothetical protein LKG05_02195 [Clostridium tyrobutyricum]|nr:hypothetical protein [Clostridium tyrobutyricum]